MFDFLNNIFNQDNQKSSVSLPDSSPSIDIKYENKMESTMNNNYSTVYDINGAPKQLGQFVNRGGEGNVYRLKENPKILVKIYNSSERANRQKDKIIAMKDMQKLRNNKQLAWPQIDIYDASGNFIGFAMGEKKGLSLNQLGVPQLVEEKLPNWNRKHLVKAALSFVDCVEKLHNNNVIIGDVNPGNFLIDPKTSKVSCIDCDSYQAKNGSQTFFCEVGMQQYMAPEFIGSDMKKTIRTREQDLFSTAMMIYRIFMFGAHPYSRVNGQDPVSNLKSGQCPLGTESGCKFPRGNWYNYWSHLPFKLKSVFIQMFRDGHDNPEKRPELRDFRSACDSYNFHLSVGNHSLELMPKEPKSSDYNGNK